MVNKILTTSELMDLETSILNDIGYSSGGYYKDQEENKEIYNAVKKALMKLDSASFKKIDFHLLEEENFHSLSALIMDIRKELKNE